MAGAAVLQAALFRFGRGHGRINRAFNVERRSKGGGPRSIGLIDFGAAALLLFTMGMAEASSEPRPLQYAQVTVREQIMVRIPFPVRRAEPLIDWKESKGPKCVPARMIVAAALSGQDSVDFLLRDRNRVRARLEDRCPALDYYRGFYIDTTADGRICAGRDFIRSRAGGECQIDEFLALTAQRR